MYEKMTDPDSGVFEYLGTKECQHSGVEYYAFKFYKSYLTRLSTLTRSQ